MTRYLTILAITTLAACGGDKDPGDTGGGPAECAITILNQTPDIDATDVYYRTDVRVNLSAADPSATIVLTDDSGAEVPGGTTVTDANLLWVGDAPLASNATYTVTVNYECGPATYTITTSDVGTPVGDLDLTGAVYSLDLTSGDWVEPANVGDILGQYLEGTEIFVTATEVTDASIKMLGGIGADEQQDLCSPTIDFPAADWTDPFFELTAPALTLTVDVYEVNIENLELSGAFASDGGRIQGTSLQGTIDTRALVAIIDSEGTENLVCQTVGAIGVACIECTDQSGPFCLKIWVDNINGNKLPASSTLVPRTPADIEADTVTCPPDPPA